MSAPLNVGDKVVWAADLADPTLREGTVTRVSRDGLVWVDYHHLPEDCIYAAYCWPASARGELIQILDTRARLKKAFDDSMKLVYELRNRVSRGEFK